MPLYELKVQARFAAAHNLREFEGKCEDLHGHNWLVEVWVGSDRLGEADMVVDFGIVKKHLADVLETLDHKYLNEVDFFKKANPSSENIARYIYEQLAPRIPDPARLLRTAAWESDNACAIYNPSG